MSAADPLFWQLLVAAAALLVAIVVLGFTVVSWIQAKLNDPARYAKRRKKR